VFLLTCDTWSSAVWLAVAAVISAIFRFAMWEFGSHERAKMYALSSGSVEEFRKLADKEIIHDANGYRLNSTETEIPPLYHPLAEYWALWKRYASRRAVAALFRGFSTVLKQRSGTPSRSQSTNSRPWRPGNHQRFRDLPSSTWDLIKHEGAHPLKLLHNGTSTAHAAPTSHPTLSAMRYRPLYILLHLSTNGRNPLMTLFTGFVEGLILIALTFFFGSMWAGNLLVMSYTLALLLVTITIGRGLGLLYVVHSAKIWGLHVIETEEAREIEGCLRILCSVPEVLVYVNGSWVSSTHQFSLFVVCDMTDR
jgi:hypothetical protein